MTQQEITKLKGVVRNIPDFPVAGVQFKDLTTLFKNAECLQLMEQGLVELFRDKGVTKVLGIESRGFIGGSLLAARLGAGFVPIRKPGKLPAETVSKSYSKE